MGAGSIRTRPQIFSAGFAARLSRAQRRVAMVADQVRDDSSKPDLDAIWQATRERLRASVPESTFNLWLAPLEPIGEDGETLYLSAPDNVRAWAERRYRGLISEALADSG